MTTCLHVDVSIRKMTTILLRSFDERQRISRQRNHRVSHVIFADMSTLNPRLSFTMNLVRRGGKISKVEKQRMIEDLYLNLPNYLLSSWKVVLISNSTMIKPSKSIQNDLCSNVMDANEALMIWVFELIGRDVRRAKDILVTSDSNLLENSSFLIAQNSSMLVIPFN